MKTQNQHRGRLPGPRQKVTGQMQECRDLIEAIHAEDLTLRQRLTSCSSDLREAAGTGGGLSFKETLGHIAFWDDFTVHFFQRKLKDGSTRPARPAQFEERNRQALAKVRLLSFPEVLSSYIAATGQLVKFLQENWEELSERQRQDFSVPLQHRMHHRAALFQSLDEMAEGPGFMVAAE